MIKLPYIFLLLFILCAVAAFDLFFVDRIIIRYVLISVACIPFGFMLLREYKKKVNKYE